MKKKLPGTRSNTVPGVFLEWKWIKIDSQKAVDIIGKETSIKGFPLILCPFTGFPDETAECSTKLN